VSEKDNRGKGEGGKSMLKEPGLREQVKELRLTAGEEGRESARGLALAWGGSEVARRGAIQKL